MTPIPTLTLDQLHEWQACHEAVTAFHERWPSGTAPLTEVVAALVADEKWWWWESLLRRHADLTAQRAEFDRIMKEPLAKYQRIQQHAVTKLHRSRSPDVERYSSDWLTAGTKYFHTQQSAWAKYQRIWQHALRDLAQQFLAQ